MKHFSIGRRSSFLVLLFLFLLVPQSFAQEVGKDDLIKYEEAWKLYDRGEHAEALQLFKELDNKNLGFWRNFRVNKAIKRLQARIEKEGTRPAPEEAAEAPIPAVEPEHAKTRGKTSVQRYEEGVRLYRKGMYDKAGILFEDLRGENLGSLRNRRVIKYLALIDRRKARGGQAIAAAPAPEKEEEEPLSAEAESVTHEPQESESAESRALAILEREKQLERIASEKAKFLAGHHLNVGKNFYEKLDYEKARVEFQAALTMNPKLEEALLYLEKCNAMLDIRKARIPEFARREFEMSKARVDRARLEMERLYQEGKRLLEDGNFEKAIARLMAVREIVHWMPYKEDVSEYDRGTTELIEQAKEEQKRQKGEMDRIRREEAARALAGEIVIEKKYKRQKIRHLRSQAVEFRRMRKFEKAIKLYDEILVLEPEDFRATIGKVDCQVYLLEKKKEALAKERALETEKSWLHTDSLAIPQTDVVKKPDDWEIVKQRTIPRFGREVTVPSWRPPLEELLGTKKVSIFFTETPLSQVLQFLGDLTELDFVADLEEDIDPLITIRVNSMTLRNALNWIATLSGTRWGLKNEAVYFGLGTVEEPILRFYPIRDLMYEPTDFPGVGFAISVGGEEAGGFALEEAAEEEIRFDPEMLMQFIKSIDEESWEDEAGKNKIEYHAGMLLIINTPEVHQKVEDLLAHFRATRGLQVSICSQFIEMQDNFLEDLGLDLRGLAGRDIPEVGTSLTGSDAGILGRRGGNLDWRMRVQHVAEGSVSGLQTQTAEGGLGLSISILNDIQVKMILHAVRKTAKANIIVAPKITCFDGQRANVTVAEQVSYIADYEVETSGDDAVGASPEIERALDGVSLDVRPIVSADRRFITIEVRPTLARLKRPIQQVDVTLGEDMTSPIDLPEASLKTIQTTVMIPDGGTILLGGLMDRAEMEYTIGVPFLSKIPIINHLFRRKAKGIDRRNLILLIRGKIISLDESFGRPI